MSRRRLLSIALGSLLAMPADALVFSVTSTADSGAGSLRAAVAQANAAAGADTIVFDLPEGACSAGGACRIDLATTIEITDDVVLDGTTQPRFGTAPANVCATPSAPSSMRIEIVGPSAFGVAALAIAHTAGPAGSVIRGVAVGGGPGIAIRGSGRHRVQCSHVGVDAAGFTELPVVAFALVVELDADGAIVGTDGDGVGDVGERNVLAAAGGHAIYVNSNRRTRVSGNYFGLGADGSAPLECAYGFYARQFSHTNLVGSDFDGVSDELERNVFGPCYYPVWIDSLAVTAGEENVVAGNWIGLDAGGQLAPAGIAGIYLTSAGAGTVVRRNRIEGNPTGVLVEGSAAFASGSEDNCFTGNTVALQHAGSAALVFERNWWGAADGPSGDLPGSGDALSVTGPGSADVIPFLSEGCPVPEAGAVLSAAAALVGLGLRRLVEGRLVSKSRA